MASLLRHIVAGPRAKHAETGLDLCYVTSNIIATSGPSQTYPQRAYRNPLDQLVAFLDAKHGENWAIWEFRAEGTGYPDEAVYNRIRHYPWPDHHPPPFQLVPLIVSSMRQWLQDDWEADANGSSKSERVVVVHCKAGKGRSGTMACSYLISECGWSPEKALDRFTERRMRPRFGAGVTIPSQVRWVGYVDRWARHGKKYVDCPVEIVEIHVWGLRHGVKLVVEGYEDEGKRIHAFHTFKSDERFVIEGDAPGGGGFVDMVSDMAKPATQHDKKEPSSGDDSPASGRDSPVGQVKRQQTDLIASPVSSTNSFSQNEANSALPTGESSAKLVTKAQTFAYAAQDEPGGQAVIFKPEKPIRIPNSDINIEIERRNKASLGRSVVTSVAHVWFNVFFEGNGPEQDGKADDSGVFAIDWSKMDGIKGSSQRGTQAAERIAVVWRTVEPTEKEKREREASIVPDASLSATSPTEVPQMRAADWKGNNHEDPDAGENLGLRKEDPESAEVSRASSIKSQQADDRGEGESAEEDNPLHGVKSSGPRGEDLNAEGEASTS